MLIEINIDANVGIDNVLHPNIVADINIRLDIDLRILDININIDSLIDSKLSSQAFRPNSGLQWPPDNTYRSRYCLGLYPTFWLRARHLEASELFGI